MNLKISDGSWERKQRANSPVRVPMVNPPGLTYFRRADEWGQFLKIVEEMQGGGQGELGVQGREGLLTIGLVVKTYVPPSASVDKVGVAAASSSSSLVGVAEVDSPAVDVGSPAEELVVDSSVAAEVGDGVLLEGGSVEEAVRRWRG